jgi:retron-type reverse transcriptase
MYSTIQELSFILEEEPRFLTYLEKIRMRLYSDYYIKKRNGGKREINTYIYKHSIQADNKLIFYSQKLKEVHTKIKNRIFDELDLPDYIVGFRRNVSIKDAAKKHVGKKYVISFDIHDFFGSTKSDYLYNSLIKNYGFGEMASWLIARLVSYKGRLPQGAVTSPSTANIAFLDADREIYELCKANNIIYTRYADDMTFSTDNKENIELLLEKIPEIVNKYNYRINNKKTKIFGPKSRHYVLGIITNKKLNVPKEVRRNLEAAIFNFVVKKEVPAGVKDYVKYKRSLMGKANYVLNINPTLSRLQRFKEMLKEFDPNKHVFKVKYSEAA